MRLPTYRFTDYRLAAYVVIAALIAGGVAFALDQAFAPTQKVQANGAAPPPNADGVRQIPLAKTSAADIGDPDGKLTPVYPVSPGKDMPVKDAPVIAPKQAATAPAAPVATSGTANPAAAPVAQATTPAPTAATQIAAAPAAANACNVAACAAAYRSFRESDCTYAPFSGPRRYCEGAPDGNAPAGNGGQIASQPQYSTQPLQQQQQQTAPRQQFDPRTVRRLPAPGQQQFDDDDDDDDRPVVMEAPERRYDLRRNWVVEPQE